MRTLYEIDNDIMLALDGLEFDEETGEILNPETLDALQEERDRKIEGVALYVKELDAEATAIKAEEEALKERRKRKERQIEGFKGWLKRALDGHKFETPKTAVTFRKSVRVTSENEEKAPDQYMLVKTTMSVDKMRIKEDLKNGKEVEGWYLQENSNISVK